MIVAIGFGLLATSSPVAAAAPGPATTPVMIVLDASGSMTTADAPGPRIAAAKAAVVGLVKELPSSAQVGLMVYGTGTGSSVADKSVGCRDIRTLVPVEHVRRQTLIAAVNSVQARGYTPIGRALQKAAAALPPGRPGSVVLVSDGQDTCAPPSPCTVAAQLKAANRDLVVHTIGFRVLAAARRELGCIARVTGGTYRDASNGAGLGEVLRGQVDAGLRPYVVSGKPINGTATPAGAPEIAVGQYADSFPAGGAVTKYYSLELAAPETVYVASTIVPPALRGGGATGRLRVVTRLLNENGDRCLSTEREDNPVLAGKVDPVTAVLSGVVGGADWSKRCPRSGRFVVEVTRDSPSSTLTRSETLVRLEPPVEPVPPPVTTIPPGLASPPAAAGAAPCIGGASFNTAPLLMPGTCADTLATGETRYYRVHLDWGQRLSYSIVVARVRGAAHGSGYIRSGVATPLRQSVTLASSSNAARDFGGPTAITVHGSTLVPVEYGNRDSGRSDIRGYRLAGDYYLSLGMSYPADALPYRTGVLVTVRTAGRAQAGPHYLALPRPLAAGTHPSTSGGASAVTTPRPHTASGTSSGNLRWWWILVALVGAAAGALAIAFTARRRTRSGKSPVP